MDIDFFPWIIYKLSQAHSIVCVFLRIPHSLLANYNTKRVKNFKTQCIWVTFMLPCIGESSFGPGWQFNELFFTFGGEELTCHQWGLMRIYAKPSTFHGWTHVNCGACKHCLISLAGWSIGLCSQAVKGKKSLWSWLLWRTSPIIQTTNSHDYLTS